MAERDGVPAADGGGPPDDTAGRSDRSGLPADTLPRQASFDQAPLGELTGQSPIRVVRRPGQQTAALRQQLAEKAAATDELREALDELRQVLDVENPPAAAAGGRRRSWLLLAGVVVVAVAALLIFTLRDPSSPQIVAPVRSTGPSPAASGSAGASANPSAPSPTAPASGQASSAQTSAPAAAGAAPSTRPLPWPGGAVLTPPGLTTTGPGASAPGTDAQVGVDTDGTHVDVFERLLLSAPSADPLVMARPSLPAIGQEIAVSDLQVELDGNAVAVSGNDTDGWTAKPPAGKPFTSAVLRYRLANGVVTITPAAPGRVFAVVTPLTAAISQARSAAVLVRALDPRVLGVSCPRATSAAASVCGTKLATGWVATVPADSIPIVLFQVNTAG
jgi:hypothetical protein